MSEFPADWPGPGPIDLAVHDLPHASSTTEWWYLKAHVTTVDGRDASLFAAFFRLAKGRDEATGETLYAHSLTWAVTLPKPGRYMPESVVDRDAPRMGIEQVDRGEGSKDARLRRAMREVLEKGHVPWPDRMFEGEVFVARGRLELDFDGARFHKRADGAYELDLFHHHFKCGCHLVFTPRLGPVRHGDDGVVRGTRGEDMFYYFLPRCDVTGTLTLDAVEVDVARGRGWYDHEFGLHSDRREDGKREDIAWNWCGVQLDDGSELTAYTIVDLETDRVVDERAILIAPDGTRAEHAGIALEPLNTWRSTRTFNDYPTRWRLRVPGADLELLLEASVDDQEFVTVISKPAFWEGRVDVSGTRGGQPLSGLGFVERSGFAEIDDLDQFFSTVGEETRRSVRTLVPLDPTFEQARDMVCSEEREHMMEGVDIPQLTRTLAKPVREIADRGGKSWRSYAALACCDVVGGDSREYVQWLALPELMHVGSLIVDDVQDHSEIRRGGKTAHLIYGEPLAINAGTAAYFMGHKLLRGKSLSQRDQLRLYDLYFEALRAGHAGQALDIEGPYDALEAAVRSGRSEAVEERVLAIHRLKTAAPAASLARMGAVAGGGTEAQIEAVGRFFEALGLAFQIIDDVLNIRGFRRSLKATAEDVSHGKVTVPVAKAMGRLDEAARRRLRDILLSHTTDKEVLAEAVGMMEACGAVDACVEEARGLVEAAWQVFDPLVEDSLPKLMLRAFGWYVLERHY